MKTKYFIQIAIAVVAAAGLMLGATQANGYIISTTNWGDVNVVNADLNNTMEVDGDTDDWYGEIDGSYDDDQYRIRYNWAGKPSTALYAIYTYSDNNNNVEELVTTIAVPEGTYDLFVVYGASGEIGRENIGAWARMTAADQSVFFTN